jgi:hypothetical protein
MAVALDSVTAGNGTTSFSFDVTPSGTPRGIAVLIGQELLAEDQISGITYGGVTMTEVTGSPVFNNPTNQTSVAYGYFLGASIPTGTQSLSITCTGSSEKRVWVVVVTAAADTEIADITILDIESTTGDITGTLSLGGASSFCCQGGVSSASVVAWVTPITGWTERGEVDMGAEVAFCHTYDTVGTSDVTMGITHGSAESLACIGIAIKELAAGGTTYERTHTDGMQFFDPDSREALHEQLEQLYLGSATLRDLLRQGLHTDGILLDSRSAREILIERFEGLFLDTIYEALYEPGAGGPILRSVTDGLLLGDDAQRHRELVQLTNLLLSDERELIRELTILAGLLLGDSSERDVSAGFTLHEITATDGILLDEITYRLREVLWSEGLFLGSSLERLVIGEVIDHLVYARLQVKHVMPARIGAVDFLGRRIGITKWRLN